MAFFAPGIKTSPCQMTPSQSKRTVSTSSAISRARLLPLPLLVVVVVVVELSSSFSALITTFNRRRNDDDFEEEEEEEEDFEDEDNFLRE